MNCAAEEKRQACHGHSPQTACGLVGKAADTQGSHIASRRLSPNWTPVMASMDVHSSLTALPPTELNFLPSSVAGLHDCFLMNSVV